MSSMPKDFSTWPPPAVAKLYDDVRHWSAWWSGDTDELAAAYGASTGVVTQASPQGTVGIASRIKRMFWGSQPRPQEQQSPKLHLAVAGDIVNTAANLLFGDRPSFVIGDPNEKSKRVAPGAPKRAFDEDAGTMMPNPQAYETRGRKQSFGGGDGSTPPKRAAADPKDPSTKPSNAPGGARDDDPNAAPGTDPEASDNGVQIETPEDPAQQRLDELFGKKAMSQLKSAAKVQAGLGGVYVRVVWDEAVADYPILDVVHPDAAIPEFKWDHLTEVTFWRTVHEEKGAVWRHLERHHTVMQVARDEEGEPDEFGNKPVKWKTDRKTGEEKKPTYDPDLGLETGGDPEFEKQGWIEHAVFEGDHTQIGLRRAWTGMADWPAPVMEAMEPHLELMMSALAKVPIDAEDPESELVPDMSQFGTYATGLKMLDVVFVPGEENITRRVDSMARRCGMADYAPAIPFMDALDEAWTSWMRDIRLGRARIFVPQEYLENLGTGKGATFNAEQEVYVPVNTLAGSDATAGLAMELFQPEVRFEAHERTCTALASEIIGKSGYSAQTFGLTGAVAMTATESNARERKTEQTMSGKENAWQVALPQLCKIMMAVDELVFSGMQPDDDITVEFKPFQADGPVEMSQAISTLMTAKAMSQRTAIRTLHPDWDDDQVDAELLEIDSSEPEPPIDPLGLEMRGADREDAKTEADSAAKAAKAVADAVT